MYPDAIHSPAPSGTTKPGPVPFQARLESHVIADRRKADDATWHPPGGSVTIQKIKIKNPMIYTGVRLSGFLYRQNDDSLISPHLEIIPSQEIKKPAPLIFIPGYNDFSPEERYQYLRWLATGRSLPETQEAFLLLFLYGIERRLLLDGIEGQISATEREEITKEIRRLLELYPRRPRFQKEAKNLLCFEWLLYRNHEPLSGSLRSSSCSSFLLSFEVARQSALGQPLEAETAWQWMLRTTSFNRQVAARAKKELHALFFIRYSEKFGKGVLIRPVKKRLQVNCTPGNPSLYGRLNYIFPDLPGLFYHSGAACETAVLLDACMKDLEPYSRFCARHRNERHSLKALSLLPAELLLDSPPAKALLHLFPSQNCDKSVLLRNEQIVQAWQNAFHKQNQPWFSSSGHLPHWSDLPGAFFDALGYTFAPDARYHATRVKESPAVVVLPGAQAFSAGHEFSVMLALINSAAGLFCAGAGSSGKKFPEECFTTVQKIITENPLLSAPEKNSLKAFLAWRILHPENRYIKPGQIKKTFESLPEARKLFVAKTLAGLLQQIGLSPKGIIYLEKLYPWLGFKKQQALGDLHFGAVQKTAGLYLKPISSFSATPQKEFSLQEELIQEREKETNKVQKILEPLFSQEDAPPAALQTQGQMLDHKHQELARRLLQQETWARADFDNLCKEFQLMPGGAMETLNEWSFQTAGMPLVEDEGFLYIETSLQETLYDTCNTN